MDSHVACASLSKGWIDCRYTLTMWCNNNFRAVFHKFTMDRHGPPTIQNNPFHLTPHEWEGHEDKWNRQGELSHFPRFWACGGRSRDLEMYQNQKSLPAFLPPGMLNELWIYKIGRKYKFTCCSILMINSWQQSVKYIWVISTGGNYEKHTYYHDLSASASEWVISSLLMPWFLCRNVISNHGLNDFLT